MRGKRNARHQRQLPHNTGEGSYSAGSFTLGYAYEPWRYGDAGYNGYQYTIPFPGVSNNTSQSYLNGYLAFNNYNANIVYLRATYKFDTLSR